jgi:TonB family protein
MAPVLSLSAIAQNAMIVNASALNEHINHRSVPIYPPIAKAARVQGAVVFDIEVGVAGNIESMKVVSGPPMLQQAAIDCLKQWTFRPFEKDGLPVSATGPISIEFTLDEASGPHGESKSAEFASSQERCRSAIQKSQDSVQAANLCRQAADLAESLFPAKVSSPDEEISKRNALVIAARALFQDGSLAEAQNYADKAVAIVSEGYDFYSDCVWAFSGRAVIEIQLKQFEAADRDLMLAIDRERHFMEMQKPFPSAILTTTQQRLAAFLRARAENLIRLNRSDEAKSLLQEATKYE